MKKAFLLDIKKIRISILLSSISGRSKGECAVKKIRVFLPEEYSEHQKNG